MNLSVALLVALALMAGAAFAMPTGSDVTFQFVHPAADASELENESTLQERVRRSPEDKNRGTVTGGVHREPGVGTVVQAQGQGNIWTSKDGNAKVDAHGDWSKVVDGPGRGKPNYSGGITFSGRF